MDTKLSRRSFVAGSAVAAGAAALGATGIASADEPAAPVSSWKIAPEPIGDDQIAETFEADLVVVGAGAAGCMATATAVDDGASVILLQKDEEPFCHGYAFAANGTSKQKEAGVEVDGWEVMNHINLLSENKAKTEVIRNWVKYSGEMTDWLAEKIDGVEGVGPIILESPEPADDEWNYTFTVTHLPVGNFTPIGSVPPVIKYLIAECDPALLDAHYNTPAVQLRKDESGRVTGVIAQREDGSYILCNAKKGVILCAGDYGNDLEMRDELMPYAKGLPAGYAKKTDTGDGHKMAVWIGAAMEPAPHACNIHYDPELKYPNYQGTVMPWLRVNANGERFSNEDVPYEQIYAKDMHNPGLMHFQVFDADYTTTWKEMGKGGAMRANWDEIVPQALEAGDLRVGETLEELAEAMEVPVDVFVATVERYNELCDKGYDEDFGKQAARMKKVATPPFYAFARQASCLTPLGGLEIYGNMQVLDESGKPIEGLYAAGNNSGNFFGGFVQRMCAPGFGVGRAFLTGRVAAKRAIGAEY
ncbi:MAG: FAD-binding protein [Coriobacteriales bacterium]|nr:FAD-binding protein [Coriobacteriales bacterium]